MKNSIQRKLNIIIALLVLLAAAAAACLVCLVMPYHSQLAWRVDSWLHDKKIPYTHNNIYTDGMQGILDDIESRLDLPDTLYISNAQTIDYDVDGTVTDLYLFLHGVKDNGDTGHWLVYYNADSSENRRTRETDGSDGNLTVTVSSSKGSTSYEDTMLLQPMLDLVDALDLPSLSQWYTALSYADSLELTYWGYREMEVNSYTYLVTPAQVIAGATGWDAGTLSGEDVSDTANTTGITGIDVIGRLGRSDTTDTTTTDTIPVLRGTGDTPIMTYASLQRIDPSSAGTYRGYEISLNAPDSEAAPARYFANNDWLTATDYVDPVADAQERHEESLEAQRVNTGLQGTGYLDTNTGTMYCYISDTVGYRLVVADAAAGSRFYQLERTTDGGATWALHNRDPFLGLIGVVGGMQFDDELHGRIWLDSPSGGTKETCETTDGGVTFTAVDDAPAASE